MTIAFVSSAFCSTGDSNGGTSGSMTSTGATFLVGSLGYYSGGTGAFADNKSNSFNSLTIRSGGDDRSKLLYTTPPAIVDTVHTVTASGSGAYGLAALMAFSGLHASPFLFEDFAHSDTNVTSLQLTLAAPSVPGCLIIIGSRIGGGASSPTINNGFTSAIGGPGYFTGLHYKIQTTAAAEVTTLSWSGATTCIMCAAVFKPMNPLLRRRRKAAA